jgi:hypothetical protein
VNTLEADLVCHTGDIPDGTAECRRAQAVLPATVRPPEPVYTHRQP